MNEEPIGIGGGGRWPLRTDRLLDKPRPDLIRPAEVEGWANRLEWIDGIAGGGMLAPGLRARGRRGASVCPDAENGVMITIKAAIPRIERSLMVDTFPVGL